MALFAHFVSSRSTPSYVEKLVCEKGGKNDGIVINPFEFPLVFLLHECFVDCIN